MSETPLNSPEVQKTAISIEVAQPEDAAPIIELKNRTWLDTYPNPELGLTYDVIKRRVEGENGEVTARSVEAWARMIGKQGPEQAVFVARKGTQVVGVAAPGFMNGQRRLGALYVSPDEQGQGVGSRLLQTAIDWHGRDEDIFLHVATYNQGAIDFYTSFGFISTETVIQDEVAREKGWPEIPEMEMILKAR